MKTCEQGALSREAEGAHAPHQHAAPLPDQWCMKLQPGSCNRHIHLMENHIPVLNDNFKLFIVAKDKHDFSLI